MMKKSVNIYDYQNYLKQKYEDASHTQALFMKLVEEIGEVAEAINKKREENMMMAKVHLQTNL